MYSSEEDHALFWSFEESAATSALAEELTFSLNGALHPLSRMAANGLQLHLRQQQDWKHNFGLLADGEGVVIGKMFGVLVVRTKEGRLGYVAAFSGKLAGANHHPKFVPPIFDGLVPGGFVNTGMLQLTQINQEISALESLAPEVHAEQIHLLKILRKDHSLSLQHKIFEQYHFINKAGESKSLLTIFEETPAGKPAAGAGECAAPKLLQYAYRHQMEPLALAEFWWGLSPKSAYWKHGHFYAPCREKCAPILAHMLS